MITKESPPFTLIFHGIVGFDSPTCEPNGKTVGDSRIWKDIPVRCHNSQNGPSNSNVRGGEEFLLVRFNGECRYNAEHGGCCLSEYMIIIHHPSSVYCNLVLYVLVCSQDTPTPFQFIHQ